MVADSNGRQQKARKVKHYEDGESLQLENEDV